LALQGKGEISFHQASLLMDPSVPYAGTEIHLSSSITKGFLKSRHASVAQNKSGSMVSPFATSQLKDPVMMPSECWYLHIPSDQQEKELPIVGA
jgi:hypothetical protein